MTASKRCSACGSRFWIRPQHYDITSCFFCGSWREALDLLAQNNIEASEVLDILRHTSCSGITIEVARMAVEVFKTEDDKPN